MPNTPWVGLVTQLRDGDKVDAAHTNRPLGELAQRTQHLKERFDAALVGQALTAREQPVSATAKVGMPVFYNSETAQFEPAKAVLDCAKPTVYTLAPSAIVVGVISHKYSDTLADITLLGMVDNLDLTEAAGANYVDGPYFLSAITAGGLVPEKPPAGLFVCYAMGDKVFVNPNVKEVLEEHIHYVVDLDWRWCGEATFDQYGALISLNDPLLDVPGWLPADDPYFEGKAPANAKYGYNYKADPILKTMFPLVYGTLFIECQGVGMLGTACVADANGIWWMADDPSLAPWPYNWDDTSGAVARPASLEYTGFPLRDGESWSLRAWTSRMVFKTEKSAVTSLTAFDPTQLAFVDADGNPASAGCLRAKLLSTLSQTESDNLGTSAVKSITDNTYKSGPIVVGIKGDNKISVTGTTAIAGGYVGGLITISSSASGVIGTGPVELIALDDARKEIIYGLPMIEFLNGRISSITCKVWLGNFAGPLNCYIGLWVLGRKSGSGTLPTLTYTAQRIASPGTGKLTFSEAMDVEDAITFTGSVSLNEYVQVYSPALTVNSGDMLTFTLARNAAGAGDGYAGNIAVMNMFYELRTV